MAIAKATRSLPRKLAGALTVDVALITLLFIIAFHPTWMKQSWVMQNNQIMQWDVSLLHVYGGANCDAVNMPYFHAVCMAVFKNAIGDLSTVRQFVCGLRAGAPLKIQPEFEADARIFGASCDEITSLQSLSLVFFWLVVSAAILIIVGFLALVRFSYMRFLREHSWLYYLSLSSRFLSLVIVCVVSAVYPQRIKPLIPRIWDYVDADDPTNSPIRFLVDSTDFGIGLALLWLTAAIALCSLILYTAWVPIVNKSMLRKKSSTADFRKDTGGSRIKEAFWAFMPEVFNPDIYVAELSEPSIVAYEPHEQESFLIRH